jgi:hypothetical protein
MKLTTLIVTLSCLSAQAFGVSPRSPVTKSLKSDPALVSSLRKQAPATNSALFRDTSLTRGGAVPGWAAYNDALDTHPLTSKACTSLVGWFLGDLLAQVSVEIHTLVSRYLGTEIDFLMLHFHTIPDLHRKNWN